MKDELLKYWIALKFVPDVGNVIFKNLVCALGSPSNVFHASVSDLTGVDHVTKKVAHQIKEFNDWARVEKELIQASKSNISIITSSDTLYPKNLLNTYDYPPFLYVKGHLFEKDINVAVVGSRLASTYGKFITERLCRELAMSGITIVSGMARGIDSAAHTGALAGKGRTIAVLGSGIDVIYPPENRKLYDKIAATGAVITEFPLSTEPSGPNFPARNRIISGMSLGVIVAEANERSGSLITARFALDQGRDVFAIPGSIDSPGSKGTHRLLREGAKLCENIDDVLEEILPQVDIVPSISKEDSSRDSNIFKDSLDGSESAVLSKIGKRPVHIDTLIPLTGCSTSDLLNILLSLELKGYIEQLPGKTFIIKE
ncbi:MAG: DNA-processing protein DprA [Deltaproteobacteria bacterium]|nr:DNA-processing protein DprA [Deltaproteobacteria bacterium]